MDNPFLDSSAVLSEATLDPDPLVEDFMQELEQRKEKILQDVQQQQHLLESPAVSFSQKTLDDSQLAYVDADQSFMIQDVQGNTPATAAEQSAGIQSTVLQQSQTASVAQDVLEEGFPERGRSRLPPLPTVEQTLTLEGSQPTLPVNIFILLKPFKIPLRRYRQTFESLAMIVQEIWWLQFYFLLQKISRS